MGPAANEGPAADKRPAANGQRPAVNAPYTAIDAAPSATKRRDRRAGITAPSMGVES